MVWKSDGTTQTKTLKKTSGISRVFVSKDMLIRLPEDNQLNVYLNSSWCSRGKENQKADLKQRFPMETPWSTLPAIHKRAVDLVWLWWHVSLYLSQLKLYSDLVKWCPSWASLSVRLQYFKITRMRQNSPNLVTQDRSSVASTSTFVRLLWRIRS